MNHPDDVARLREIKRLLERIQRLPRLASLQMNGSTNGLAAEHHAGPANGLHNSHLGPPHPTAEVGLALELEREPAGLPLVGVAAACAEGAMGHAPAVEGERRRPDRGTDARRRQVQGG